MLAHISCGAVKSPESRTRGSCRNNSYRIWDTAKINAAEINTTDLEALETGILTLWILRALIFPVCLT